MNLFPDDTVAVVTGGSRGIGRAVACDLAREGARVALTYSADEDGAKQTVRDIEAAGGTASLHKVDVADELQVRTFFRDVRSSYGRLDVLVSNAGVTRDGFIATMSAEKFKAVIDVNLLGTFHVCREAMKIMANQRRGAIVTVSSSSGIHGMAGQTNYCASKGGVASFTRALALEGARFNVRANVVAPGLIETDMTRVMGPELLRDYEDRVPLKRGGTPQEVASVVSFLASERAAYMTASVVTVDGGLM